MTCVRQIILAIQPDTLISAFLKYPAIGKHLLEVHGDKNLLNEGQFHVFKKCQRKFDCLVYEMMFIKGLRLSLNTQISDSIIALFSL